MPVHRPQSLPHPKGLPPAHTTISLYETAQSILALLPENAPYCGIFWSASADFIEVAVQIPYSHPSQLTLATLIKQLSMADKFMERQNKQV
ncbi:hypothetical protein BJX76DRAFT_331697, partial [Aspergillus varians]